MVHNEASDVELPGLGNRPTVRGFLDLQKREEPDILFLSETKMDRRRIEKFRWSLGLTNLVFKECVGKSGGLALFWRNGVDVRLRSLSKYWIDVDVADSNGDTWCFTGIYGEPQADKKDVTWAALRTLYAGDQALGYVQEISMRSCLHMRSKVGRLGPNLVWIDFGKHWRYVAWMIWALKVIHSRGETIATGEIVTLGRD